MFSLTSDGAKHETLCISTPFDREYYVDFLEKKYRIWRVFLAG